MKLKSAVFQIFFRFFLNLGFLFRGGQTEKFGFAGPTNPATPVLQQCHTQPATPRPSDTARFAKDHSVSCYGGGIMNSAMSKDIFRPLSGFYPKRKARVKKSYYRSLILVPVCYILNIFVFAWSPPWECLEEARREISTPTRREQAPSSLSQRLVATVLPWWWRTTNFSARYLSQNKQSDQISPPLACVSCSVFSQHQSNRSSMSTGTLWSTYSSSRCARVKHLWKHPERLLSIR